MDRLVDEYVTKCREEGEALTLTGMILYLGLSSRQSLDRYGDREEFSDSVRRAKLLIEHEYERKLDRDKPTGAIFALKNMGWSDRQQVELQGSLSNLNVELLPHHLIERLANGESPWSVLASATEDVRKLLSRSSASGPGAAGQRGVCR